MDVTSLEQIRHAVHVTATHFGRLDILVNNAGIAPGNPAEDFREDDFDLTLRVNLKGTFFACQAAGRIMIHRGGRIINLGSQAGAVALPTESVYCMTKAAIAHLTKCLAVEWGKYNITVNAVARPSFLRRAPRRPWPTSVSRRRGGAHRGLAPYRRADGGGRRGGVPGLTGGVADHRPYHADRWRLDSTVSSVTSDISRTRPAILPTASADSQVAASGVVRAALHADCTRVGEQSDTGR